MKKIMMICGFISVSIFAFAQTAVDATKYVQTDINGTARYMSMAGAFGALGGDASAIKDNPAGLGVYRSSELTTSVNFMLQNTSANWGSGAVKEDYSGFKFNNFAFIIASPTWLSEKSSTGLMSSNFSFSYNRLKNFSRNLSISNNGLDRSLTDYMCNLTDGLSTADLEYIPNKYDPYGNTDIAWLSVLGYEGGLMYENDHKWNSLLGIGDLVTPSYNLYEKGHIDEYSIGWSGNFSHRFYLGFALNVKTINYSAKAVYQEAFDNVDGFTLTDEVKTTAAGVNLNVGAIYKPTDEIRLGAAIHIPTVYQMSDNYYGKINSKIGNQNFSSETPTDGDNTFSLTAPFQFNLSGAYIIGKKVLISVEYVLNNYSKTRFLDKDGNSQIYKDDNHDIKQMLSMAHTIKIGGEFRIDNNFSLRAGYAFMDHATNSGAKKIMLINTIRTDAEYFLHKNTNYITAGFGYREKSWYIDFAYMYKSANETYLPFNLDGTKSADVITNTNNIVATLGLRF